MVRFSLEPSNPLADPVDFRFTVKAAQLLEEAAGCSPAYLAVRGQNARAMVLMVQFGLLHSDPKMTQAKAQQLIEKYLEQKGKTKDLMEALVKAMNQSGIYGEPDEKDDEEDENRPPQTPVAVN